MNPTTLPWNSATKQASLVPLRMLFNDPFEISADRLHDDCGIDPADLFGIAFFSTV
jgi:hypothetical protein